MFEQQHDEKCTPVWNQCCMDLVLTNSGNSTVISCVARCDNVDHFYSLQAARKLAITEVDLERSETRLEAAEAYVSVIVTMFEPREYWAQFKDIQGSDVS